MTPLGCASSAENTPFPLELLRTVASVKFESEGARESQLAQLIPVGGLFVVNSYVGLVV